MNHDVGGELVAPMEMVDSWQRCGEFLLLHQQRTALYVLLQFAVSAIFFDKVVAAHEGVRGDGNIINPVVERLVSLM